MTLTEVVSTADVAPGASPQQARAHRPPTEVVVALAQMAPRLGDVAANLERHLTVASEARARGAGLVLFPELSLTGYFLKDLVPDVALRVEAPEIAALAEASAGVDIVAGCVIEGDDARFFNAALYFAGGRLHHVHRKVYLPTYGLFDESRYMAQGDRFRAFSPPMAGAGRAWRAGILVCEDMWHPSAAGVLARDGVDLLICPSASPARGVGRGQSLGTAQSYDAMTRTYAQLFTAYVVYCNRVGFEDGVAFWGGSRAVGPDGRLLAEPAGRDECLALYPIDLDAVRRARIANPLLRDERHDVTDSENSRLRRRRTRD